MANKLLKIAGLPKNESGTFYEIPKKKNVA